MKKFLNNTKSSILFLMPILITSCGGGFTMKLTDGSKIQFKRENVFCEKGSEYYGRYGERVRNLKCTANGVRTFLTGDRTNFSETKICSVMNEKGKDFNNLEWYYGIERNSLACRAAIKFGKSK